jgi:hypothetical protein
MGSAAVCRCWLFLLNAQAIKKSLTSRFFYFRLFRFLQPSLTASFSGIDLTLSCFLSSLISTMQGSPILNGKAVSSLTFVGI